MLSGCRQRANIIDKGSAVVLECRVGVGWNTQTRTWMLGFAQRALAQVFSSSLILSRIRAASS